MYLGGAPHTHKSDAQRLLERAISEGERLGTDAEVLREILHRYVAIARLDAIQPAFDAALGVVDEVLTIEVPDVERAKTIVQGHAELSARDAIHLAIMDRIGAMRIMSFARGIDAFPGITRLGA